MSSTSQSQNIADGEELFFVFDEDSVTFNTISSDPGIPEQLYPSIPLSSDPELHSYEYDSQEMPSRKVSTIRRKRKVPRQGAFSILSFPPFAPFAENLSPDVEDLSDSYSSPTSCNVMSSDLPFISSRQRTYRKFRFYDLIRSNIGVEDPSTPPSLPSESPSSADNDTNVLDITSANGRENPNTGKVQFNTEVEIYEFSPDDMTHRIEYQEEDAFLQPFPSSTSVHIPYRPPSDSSYFAFSLEIYSPKVISSLNKTCDDYRRNRRADLFQIHNIMVLACKQVVFTTDNVVGGFEGLSALGKRLLGLVNRLQASSTRVQVVADTREVPLMEIALMPEISTGLDGSHKPEKEKSHKSLANDRSKDKMVYLSRICECLIDCEELQAEIQRLRDIVVNSEKHMNSHLARLTSSIQNSISCSKRVRSLFAAIYENDASARATLHAIISMNNAYAKCINFLTEMGSERIFKFWNNDFRKLYADLKNIDYLCGLMLDQISKALLASQIEN